MNFKSGYKGEEGSVLLFGIGLGVVLLIVLTTAVNIATLWVTKSKLNSVADATAIAAAHSIDIQYVYINGISGPLQLNENLAKTRASIYLRRIAIETELNNFKLVNLTIGQNSVEIAISSKVQLPFGYLLPGVDPVVAARAKAAINTR